MKYLAIALSILIWFGGIARAEDLPLVSLTTAKGIVFNFVRSDIQDTVAVSIAFRGGMASDDSTGPATAFIAPSLMTTGAGGKSNSELYEAFQDVGGAFSVSANTDQTYAELSAPSKRIMEAAALANLVLTKPDFPELKLKQRREALAERIEEINSYPEGALQMAFNLAAAEPHIYQNYFSPNAEAVRRVTKADLLPWVARHITRDRILVSVVGKLDHDKASEIVDIMLEGLPLHSDLPNTPRMVFKPAPRAPIRVAFATGDQAILSFGMAQDFKADLHQWLAASMLSQIFVGDQKSRLFKDIRESSGATYGLQPNLAFYDAMLVNSVSGRIDKSKIDETVALVRKSWDKFREDGPDDEEIANARANMGEYIRNSTRAHVRLSGLIRDYMTGHWTAEEIRNMPQMVEKIDLKDKALLKDLFPENPIIVIAQ